MRFERFRAIADRGADRLAQLACRAIDAGGVARVALVGRHLSRCAVSRPRPRRNSRTQFADAEVVEARYEPAAGALLLAYRELGLEPERLTQ